MTYLRLARMFVLTALAAFGIAPGAAHAKPAVPHINHVFILVLENENASATFTKDSQAPYLAKTLRRKGAFLPNYFGIGHNSLDNYIAMVSGQAPNVMTQADCPVFSEFLPGLPVADGQYLGQGCVYPDGVETVANQLEGKGYTWHGYMEDLNAAAPKGQETPCRHRPAGPHPGRARGRSVRHAAQPLRLLPLDHRLSDLREERR